MKINFIDLQRQYQLYKTDIDNKMTEVLNQSNYIMGKPVFELENILAEYTGTKQAISCSSGTDALLMALMAYDIQPGDEIITTPFTFIATSEVISFLKAKPVFVDVDPKTYNIDPQLIEKAITPKTKGILPANIFGQCCDYDLINDIAKKHNLFIIEDAAQSFGAEYKGKKSCGLAEVSCTSFFPAKPFGCFGDGGMIFTNNDNLAEIMRSIRVHGKGTEKYDNVRVGLNGRMDTLQAAVLLGKWPHFEKEVTDRQTIANYYSEHLKDKIITPFVTSDNLSVFAQYTIQIDNRSELRSHLKEQGIPTAVHYPKALHQQSAFNYLNYKEGDFPVAENISKKVVSLPMHPLLKPEEQDFIIENIRSFIKNQS